MPANDHARRAKALMALAKSEGFLTGMDRGHELGVASVAAARLAAGDMAGGETHLRQAVELAQGLGLESYARVMAVGYLAQNLCGQGRVDEARQLAEAILWERAANPNTYEMVVTRSVLADIALESGDPDEAQAIFESLEEIGERRQFRLPLAMIYFGLAYAHGRKGHTETAVRYAQKSVAILEPLNTWQLFLDQGERAREVCRILTEAGDKTPFVDEVLRCLPGSAVIEGVGGKRPSGCNA